MVGGELVRGAEDGEENLCLMDWENAIELVRVTVGELVTLCLSLLGKIIEEPI